MLKIFLFGVFIFLFTGCNKKLYIADMRYYPQKIESYVGVFKESPKIIKNREDFYRDYYDVWQHSKTYISAEGAKWAFKAYEKKDLYGANLQPLQDSFFNKLKDEGAFNAMGELSAYAVTKYRVNMKNFPSSKPIFMDYKKAGEGFPFDYNQNSAIYPYEPLLLSHYSKSREWVYAQSSYAAGWIKSNSIKILTNIKKLEWLESPKIVIVDDDTPLYSTNGEFQFRTQIGMLLPYISEDKDGYSVKLLDESENNRYLHVPKKLVKNSILPMSRENIVAVTNELIDSIYGWGGSFGGRDCSSTIRDFFTPFGVWLPRNSKEQSKIGEIVDLKNLNSEDKERLIIRAGVPYRTLLYKPGHIMLYIGEHNGRAMILHNVWGVKQTLSGVNGRKIIGKTAITTLEPGKELTFYDSKKSIVDGIESMNILTH